MKTKLTSTRNIANILCYRPLAQIVKAEYRYKAQSVKDDVKLIDATTMLESIAALEDNVVFSDYVDWTYTNISDFSGTEDFIIYGDLHDSMVGTVVVMYLRVADDYTVEEVEKKLRDTIFDRIVPKNNKININNIKTKIKQGGMCY